MAYINYSAKWHPLHLLLNSFYAKKLQHKRLYSQTGRSQSCRDHSHVLFVASHIYCQLFMFAVLCCSRQRIRKNAIFLIVMEFMEAPSVSKAFTICCLRYSPDRQYNFSQSPILKVGLLLPVTRGLKVTGRGIYPPQPPWRSSPKLTSPPSPLFRRPHPCKQFFGHFMHNFVQFYACFQWILEAGGQG